MNSESLLNTSTKMMNDKGGSKKMSTNEITVKNAYGQVSLTEPNGAVITASSVEKLLQAVEAKLNDYNNPKVNVVTYVSDEETISDAMDLTMLAALACWGNTLYCGDCIKLTITAEYCPENK